MFDPSILSIEFPVEGPLLITAAVLVGIGTQLGSGCTSGHGVCGNALLSTPLNCCNINLYDHRHNNCLCNQSYRWSII